jgi:4-amino-4-deoxy-L-arabinose transferase-like glycosyltransferase
MPEPDETNQKQARIAGWVVVVAALASLPWLVLDVVDPVLSTGDGAIYQLTAASMLEGGGYSYLGEPFVIRPPGFPVLLMPVVSSAKHSQWIINLYVSLLGVAGIGLIYGFYRKQLGWLVAAGLALVCWLNPGFRALSNSVMSDVPGVTLLFACLLAERWANAKPSTRRDVTLALFIGASAYVRSALVLVAPAIALARIFRHYTAAPEARASQRPALLLILVIPVLVLAPWMWRDANAERQVPVEHTLFHSYAVAMFQMDGADPSSPPISLTKFSERVQKRIENISKTLNGRLQDRSGGFAYPWVAVLGIGCWVWVTIRRRSTAEFYAGILLLLYAVYFGFAPRVILPLYVLLLACVIQAALWCTQERLGWKRSQQLLFVCLLVVALLDFSPREGWAEIEARATENVLVAEFLEREFSPSEALASDFGAHLSLALDRPVYSLRWSAKRGGRQGVLAFIDKFDVSGVVIDRTTISGRLLGPELEARFGCTFELAPNHCVVRVPRVPGAQSLTPRVTGRNREP